VNHLASFQYIVPFCKRFERIPRNSSPAGTIIVVGLRAAIQEILAYQDSLKELIKNDSTFYLKSYV
jgi:hypothetical protein